MPCYTMIIRPNENRLKSSINNYIRLGLKVWRDRVFFFFFVRSRWAFLESLGFFSFFGVLLIRAESYRVELIMCVITVFSISLMCYVVSDLDSPFSGFFCVDTSVLADVVYRMRDMYDRAKAGNGDLSTYPERQQVWPLEMSTSQGQIVWTTLTLTLALAWPWTIH